MHCMTVDMIMFAADKTGDFKSKLKYISYKIKKVLIVLPGHQRLRDDYADCDCIFAIKKE